MSTAPVPPPAPAAGGGWWRPAALGLACVVIGFAGGFVVRGDGGDLRLAPADPDAAGESTETMPMTVSAEEQPVPPPARGQVQVAVLNGTDINGFAGMIADRAESLGYVDVVVDDAPEPNPGASMVYFRMGERQAAGRLAEDLDLTEVVRLPAGGPLATGAPAGAAVVVVLGAS